MMPDPNIRLGGRSWTRTSSSRSSKSLTIPVVPRSTCRPRTMHSNWKMRRAGGELLFKPRLLAGQEPPGDREGHRHAGGRNRSFCGNAFPLCGNAECVDTDPPRSHSRARPTILTRSLRHSLRAMGYFSGPRPFGGGGWPCSGLTRRIWRPRRGRSVRSPATQPHPAGDPALPR